MRPWSLARQLFLLQAIVVAVVVAGVGVAAYLQVDQRAHDTTADQMLAVAHTLADVPDVRTAVAGPDPTARLQPLAEQVRRDTGTDFVVVMTVDGVRFTHPDTSQIGKHYLGTITPAADGESITETYTGTLGPSVRAVVPVRDGTRVVALVAVGRTVEAVSRALTPQIFTVLGAVAVALALAAGGSFLVSRWLRRTTRDLGPAELARRNEYYDAVLHAVREGMVLLDREGRVQLVNDEARRLLDLPPDVVGRPVDELGLPPALVHAAIGETAEADDVYVAGEHVLVVSSAPAFWKGREVGAVVTLRDRTELQAVTGELDVVRGLTDALRAQNHESANRLHTVVSLIEMGRPDDAVEFATEELQVAQLLADRVVGAVEDPVLAALLLGKTAQAAERGITLTIDGEVGTPRCRIEPRDVVTLAGNLVDNAFDAAAGAVGPRVEVTVNWDASHLVLRVGDNGPGIPDADHERVLEHGWSTKAGGDAGRGVGLALVSQAARRNGGSVRIGRSPLGGAEVEVTVGAPT